VYVRPITDALSPEQAAARLRRRPGFVWLDGQGIGEGEEGGEGRRSFMGCEPIARHTSPFEEPLEAALEALSRLAEDRDRDPPMHGLRPSQIPAWIGYLGYDAIFSGAPARGRLDRSGAGPIAWFGRYDALLCWDEAGGCALVGDDAAACARLEARLALEPPRPARPRVGVLEVESAGGHREAIERALEHIAAGDIYQVNLARRWRCPYEGEALPLWLAMRRASPVPLGFYLDAGDHVLLARTMERFLRWEREEASGAGIDRGWLWTRPIKGTIARSGEDDAGEARRLIGDAKERAEHSMIVDLMRNDLGRVARIGSVEVVDRLSVEPYAGLSHLVSTVRCQTRAGTTLAQILEATFPPGSVTGAPKIRAMQIIEALERSPRGVYTGCVGYLDRLGGASFAVAIRTAQLREQTLCYHAGGGLVEASDPDRELEETELKARVLRDALEALREGGGANEPDEGRS